MSRKHKPLSVAVKDDAIVLNFKNRVDAIHFNHALQTAVENENSNCLGVFIRAAIDAGFETRPLIKNTESLNYTTTYINLHDIFSPEYCFDVYFSDTDWNVLYRLKKQPEQNETISAVHVSESPKFRVTAFGTERVGFTKLMFVFYDPDTANKFLINVADHKQITEEICLSTIAHILEDDLGFENLEPFELACESMYWPMTALDTHDIEMIQGPSSENGKYPYKIIIHIKRCVRSTHAGKERKAHLVKTRLSYHITGRTMTIRFFTKEDAEAFVAMLQLKDVEVGINTSDKNVCDVYKALQNIGYDTDPLEKDALDAGINLFDICVASAFPKIEEAEEVITLTPYYVSFATSRKPIKYITGGYLQGGLNDGEK